MLIISVILLLLFIRPVVAQDGTPRAEMQTPPRDVTITKVELVRSPFAYYGILLLEVNSVQFGVCDDRFDRNAAKVACRELNYSDGRFQPGSVLGDFPQPLRTFDIKCKGNETRLSQCKSRLKPPCLSQDYVTLYCLVTMIKEKDTIDVRIRGGGNYGLVEANHYGFWGPICNTGWTDKEANTVCKQLNKFGGVAYYATTVNDTPMVLGGFNCSQDETALGDCNFRGFDEYLGCQYDRSKGSKQRAAGVLCYEHEDGVKFSLSNNWYGKVQVKYDGEWGLVCDNNWGEKEAYTLCRQMGFKGGHAKKDFGPVSGPARYNRMDNVNCTGNEKSILECSHTAGWRPTGDSCNSASVKCDITVCNDRDIRNAVSQLEKLRHCNVIEGFLTILLIDATWEEYQKFSFPSLVEITDYLVFFRVGGLRSLRHLFPNLAIIRGDRLFLDYALVAYEMLDLTEIGLKSLVSIPRGAVRLEKNPNLCYIETIDWTKITNIENTVTNTFLLNKDVQECANRCPDTCDKTKSEEGLIPRCWTMNDCQKMLSCPASCKSGFCNGDVCCDRNCIAGCTGPSPKECTACRGVITHDKNGDPTCTQKCIHGTYEYRSRRCLLDVECVNFSDYSINPCIPTNSSMQKQSCLKLVSKPSPEPGLCAIECPSGYNVDPFDVQKCIPCKGKCPKICETKIIDSVTAAQEMAGCNIIKGYLEIKLMQGGQIGQELENNLADLEEITGYLHVHNSYALLTLHFLPSLRKIGGEILLKGRAISVFNNMNLQELFLSEVASNLTIGNGSLYFESNRKLCYKKIAEFVTAIGRDIKNMSADDISMESNGDYMPCDIQTLKVNILRVTSHIAFLNWTQMNMTDERGLIGYSINWKETDEKNVSIFQGRDACSDDLWKSKDPCTGEKCTPSLNYILGLRPWTQYAVYVRAMTISKAVQGAVSDVHYFRTQAEVPTSPLNLQVRAERPGELKVTWDPPNQPNGNVTHYQVYWQRKEFDPEDFELRDYCLSPILTSKIHRPDQPEEEEEKNETSTDGNCCCPLSEKERKTEERERNLAIQFQDYLQNQVYVKRIDDAATKKPSTAASRLRVENNKRSFNSSRERRELPNDDLHERKKYIYKRNAQNDQPVVMPPGSNTKEEGYKNMATTTPTVPSTTVTNGDVTDTNKKKVPSFVYADVFVKREFIISNLGHFEDYNVEVIACHNRPTDPIQGMLCSNQALGFGRTLPEPESDRINSSTVTWELHHNKTNAVHIKWEDPPNPNGLILTYDIEYRNPNIQFVKPIIICITYKVYKDSGMNGYVLDKLEAGSYLFRIRVTSLAGNGSWTEEMKFEVPEQEMTTMEKDMMIIVIISCLLAVMIIVVVIVWFVAKKRFHSLLRDTMFTSANPDYYPDWGVYEPDEWEVDRDNVVLIKELGQGSFGMVYEGYVKNLDPEREKVPVAVKTTNANSDDHDRYQFLQELSIMKQFKCHHVVRLIGVVSKDQPAYVLMELMPQGDLKNFLRLHRPDEEENDGRQPPSLKQILQMAGEIADGMAYLADKKFVHRDLAARNCMVGEDMTVKIGDFGMTRDIYETDYYRKGSRGLLPVRWMAPESLKDGVFTSMTDVWSYGVVLWEMATLAAQPYQGLSNEEVLRYVGSGKIMDTPERCPTKLYDLMVKCWRYRPKQRPTFKEIIEALLPDLDRSFQDVSYFFSEENAKYEESKQQAGASNNHHDEDMELEEDEDGDPHCPMNDYVDEAQLPMLGVGASNGHSVELQDIFSNTGTYPYNNSQTKQTPSSCEVCECNFREDNACRELAEGAAAQSMVNFNRQCESPNSAIGGSSDGSKDSSKSSNSSYARMNGLSVANGHVPVHMRTTPC
ncbi:hypothetical protein ACF0H5_013662 [Mactra antiquata]